MDFGTKYSDIETVSTSQTVLSDIKQDKSWIFLKEVNGTTHVDILRLPFSEICIRINDSIVIIPYNSLSDNHSYVLGLNAYIWNGKTYFEEITIHGNGSYVAIETVTIFCPINNTYEDKTSSTTMKVWYR